MVCRRDSNRSAATFTPFLSSWIRTSVSGRALMISKSFLAGRVSEPGFVDLGLALALEPDLEIGGRQTHLVAFCVDQDVGEDGNRVLALDDALEELQFPQQIRLANGEFHACAVLASLSGPESVPLAAPSQGPAVSVFQNESTNTKV